MRHLSARELSLAAIGIALIAVCSWISVPMMIPFTLQTFAVCLISGYILLGAIGIPVFSGFRGGPGALLGATGGYIVGFFFTALTVGLAVKKFGFKLPVLLISMALGILLCYAFGTVWFMGVYARGTGPISLGTALSWCVIPYLIPDAAKIALASLLALRLRPIVQKH